MIVVSNSGPLIALSEIGQLSVLSSLYDRVLIPRAVWEEVVIRGRNPSVVAAVRSATWIQTVDVHDLAEVQSLRAQVGAGESEAITLAFTIGADLLLIDDARGRRIAEAKGIAKIGVVGTLISAKRHGVIESVRPLLQQLRNSGFYMDDELMLTALEMTDEA
jgi:predicted nucleic acid-binding protein